MAKNNKSVDFQKKKGNAVAVAVNGKSKPGAILNKKQKNKKNKKAGGDNGATKSTILTKKEETVIDVNESTVQPAQETSKSSPKKAKKLKNLIVDEAVAGEVLSNPVLAKKKSNKKVVESVVKPTPPTKTKKQKNAAQKKGKNAIVVPEKQAKSDKKRKISATVDEEEEGTAVDEDEEELTTADEEDEVTTADEEEELTTADEEDEVTTADEDDDEAVEPVSDKKRKKSKTNKGDDEEMDASPKKQKSKEKKTDGETEEATKDKIPLISVFVGNLPVNTKRNKILKLFSKFGKVKSIRFRLSNGSKFFKSQSKVTAPNVIAFVDYESLDDAKSSLVLNGEKIKDNVIRVNLQSNAKTNENFDGKRTVFVGNLKYLITDQNLHDLFSCCGEIEYARTMQCDKGCNGVGYVCFKKSESISMALELNNADLQGRPVRVQRYVKKTPGDPKEKKNKKEKPSGAVRRLGKKSTVKTFNKGKESSGKKQFTGMKAKEKKKGFVKKNKKPLKGPKLLAKKIAFRDKTTKAA